MLFWASLVFNPDIPFVKVCVKSDTRSEGCSSRCCPDKPSPSNRTGGTTGNSNFQHQRVCRYNDVVITRSNTIDISPVDLDVVYVMVDIAHSHSPIVRSCHSGYIPTVFMLLFETIYPCYHGFIWKITFSLCPTSSLGLQETIEVLVVVLMVQSTGRTIAWSACSDLFKRTSHPVILVKSMHEKLFRQPTPLIASVCAVGARIGVLRTEFTGPGRAWRLKQLDENMANSCPV